MVKESITIRLSKYIRVEMGEELKTDPELNVSVIVRDSLRERYAKKKKQ